MLFEVHKIKEDLPPVKGESCIADDSEIGVAIELSDVVNAVDHGKCIHWLSDRSWSMHQMLQALLAKIGPADMWVSSYAFSELPARIVSDLKATGVIRTLYCVIDSRVDVRAASALAMLRNSCDKLKLTHTHAKVTILQNAEWYLVVVGSANYTTNKRYETGIISTHAESCSFHKKWIEDAINRAD